MLDFFADPALRNFKYFKETVFGGPFFFESDGRFKYRCISVDVHSSTLKNYYLNFRGTVLQYDLWSPMVALDAHGVARADYSKRGLNHIGVQYYPITVAQYGLGNLQLYSDTGHEQYAKAALAQAKWLMDNAVDDGDGGVVWPVHYNFLNHYDLPIPWVSAMAQGQIISILLRTHELTQQSRYVDVAGRALKPFDRLVEAGGVTFLDDEGLPFYEEFPSDPVIHVLNGHIFAMLGLHDYYRLTGDNGVAEKFEAGVNTVLKYADQFDTGFWTRYDLLRKPGLAAIRYHCLHIEQMKVLEMITGKVEFANLAEKWSGYLKPIPRTRFALHVVKERLGAITRNRLGTA